jgi:hypothetical protein
MGAPLDPGRSGAIREASGSMTSEGVNCEGLLTMTLIGLAIGGCGDGHEPQAASDEDCLILVNGNSSAAKTLEPTAGLL